MAKVQARSPPPASDADGGRQKRLKTSHSSSISSADSSSCFYPGLLEENSLEFLRTNYTSSEPFKFAVIEKLFQDDLLRGVKDECLRELSFSEKETDIYKVNQTGDLASLSYLSEAQLELLPNLLSLRDALYSQEFRKSIQAVTGCGPLSGSKQDMSVNLYTKGCHLLNHDDVIGTRRVSYILYMPIPYGQEWKKEYGGALELYPVRLDEDDIPEPATMPLKAIPPSWNQFIFFEVQPGKSFHSVEEVVVGEGYTRLSISGWFHAAQEGEEGYVAGSAPPEHKSSREQLTSSSTIFTQYPDTSETPHPDSPLSPEHTAFLLKFLNPVYLQLRTMKTLMARFMAESSLELHHFLSDAFISALEPSLLEADAADGLDRVTRDGCVPPHSAGTSGSWDIQGPPHKWRYCILRNNEELDLSETALVSAESVLLRRLQDDLFPSTAFRAWLSALTRLIVMSYSVEARRFRPGLDYTLATSEATDARLDVVLGLTPQVKNEQSRKGKGKAKPEDEEPFGWQTGEWGGWECYMAPHDEEDDPAVYRSGSSKKTEPKNATNSTAAQKQRDDDMEENDEDESTLLTVQPNFNCLLLVLRDEGVLHFVKYVSAAAAGSRWDVYGEFEVGMVEGDEDGSEDDGEDEEN
ncbi:nuclear protein [Pisolithus sp. B1]|nr:nuclear protein [Pisolithus sp. B1]